MIGEILTGTFAAATFGYLWARHRHMKQNGSSLENDKRMLQLAGVGKKANREEQNEPYWWQKFENQKLIMLSGKLPETKDELEKYLEQKKQELKSDEHMFYNGEERKLKKMQEEQERFQSNKRDLDELLLTLNKKKKE